VDIEAFRLPTNPGPALLSPLHSRDGNHPETAIDRRDFNADGTMQPVGITFEGIK